MNAGAALDEIVASVAVDPDVLELPYLRPLYDEPEFVIRNIWRLYGGWWDGKPSHLELGHRCCISERDCSLSRWLNNPRRASTKSH